MSNYSVKTLKKAIKTKDGLKQYTFICYECGHSHKEEMKYKLFASQYSDGSVSSSSRGLFQDNSSSSSSSSSSGSSGSWGGGSSGGGGGSGTSF